jgi:hypothetical protein
MYYRKLADFPGVFETLLYAKIRIGYLVKSQVEI